jgi:hypothetical protein
MVTNCVAEVTGRPALIAYSATYAGNFFSSLVAKMLSECESTKSASVSCAYHALTVRTVYGITD